MNIQVEERDMPRGKIKKLVSDKGFGFIRDPEGNDVFFYHSSVVDQAFDRLDEGQPVVFEIDENGGNGRGPRARSVQPLGFGTSRRRAK